MIVDDKPANLYALQKVLKPVDADVLEATGGQEALTAVLENDFSLMILDVQMPEMDGYELASYLRGDPKTKYVPIIFLTAHFPDEASLFEGYKSGAIDYITKPYIPQILVSKVKALLELDRNKRELQLHRDHLQELVEERVAELERARSAALNMMEDAKRSQKKVEQSEAALRSEERRTRALLDYSPVCHIIVDLQGKLQYMNRNGFSMFQLNEEADVYNKPYPFDFFPEDFCNRMRLQIKQVIATGNAQVVKGFACDTKGNEIWLDSSLIPVPNNDGDLLYLTVVSANRTIEKEAETDLKRFNKAAVGRELRMIELKEEINALCRELGREARYSI
ncbi:MAG: response regulator [Pontiellaceae bacterium]|nr:response regulator [Pontiellaceae bacterium]